MIIDYTAKEKELLARIMRAEALAEGDPSLTLLEKWNFINADKIWLFL